MPDEPVVPAGNEVQPSEEASPAAVVYGAVTFDSQVIITNHFNFGSGLLQQLKRLKHEPIPVIVSEVVASEVLRHLVDKTKSTKAKLDEAAKRAVEFGVSNLPAPQAMTGAQLTDVARARLRTYFADLGAGVIPADRTPIKRLLAAYFSGTAPFGGGQKKNEFPDAIALHSLEEWAEEQKRRVLAISGDGDWAAFAKRSSWIDVVPDVATALSTLQGQSDAVEVFAGETLDALAKGEPASLHAELTTALKSAVENMEIYPEANSAYGFEAEYVSAELLSVEIPETPEFQVVSAESDLSGVVIEVDALLTVKASADFYLSAWDSIDREYIGMGSTSATREEILEVTLLLNLAKGEEGPELIEAEVTKYPASMDFGEIELDLSDHDYDEDEWDEIRRADMDEPPASELI